jgi:hypothetical protein
VSNRFAPPADDVDSPDPTSILLILDKMRPWQKLIGWVMTVAAVLIGVLMVIAVIGSVLGGLQSMAGLICIIPIYGIMAWMYWILGDSLRSSAMFIQRAALDDTSFNVEQSLQHQATFWRIAGILTAIILVFYAIMFIVGIGFFILGASLISTLGSM